MASLPKLTLTYFDIAARAETTRVMLRAAGVVFEDKRISRAELGTLKPTLPYGSIPVLEIDGEMIAETQAIQRYAGRLSGFYPVQDAVAALMVDEILTTLDDFNETKIFPSFREQDAEKKKAMREALVAGPLPTVLRQVDARLKLFGEYPAFKDSTKVYLHELVLSGMVGMIKAGVLDNVPTTIADEHEHVVAVHEKVTRAQAAGLKAAPEDLASLQPLAHPKGLKLTYFDMKARGEHIRLALHIGGVAFEDERLPFHEFGSRKPNLPYGQVPVLNVNGIEVAQSFALLRYAGKLSGLYPSDNLVEAAKIDEIIARVETMFYTMRPSFETRDLEQKRILREQYAAKEIPDAFTALDKRVSQWRKSAPYVLGDKISIADLAVFYLIEFFTSGSIDYIPSSIVEPFTTLTSVRDGVVNHPRVVDWYAQRP